MLDFLFCFAQISWLILRDPMCECRGTCDDEEPEWLRATNMLSLCITGASASLWFRWSASRRAPADARQPSTGAFVVEIPVDLLGFGLPYYTTMRYHWLHVADSLVILTAFILEVVLQVRFRPRPRLRAPLSDSAPLPLPPSRASPGTSLR